MGRPGYRARPRGQRGQDFHGVQSTTRARPVSSLCQPRLIPSWRRSRRFHGRAQGITTPAKSHPVEPLAARPLTGPTTGLSSPSMANFESRCHHRHRSRPARAWAIPANVTTVTPHRGSRVQSAEEDRGDERGIRPRGVTWVTRSRLGPGSPQWPRTTPCDILPPGRA
jgi:hypothetical protein